MTAPPAIGVSELQAILGEQFLIQRELGRGGMATVYLARDLAHDRTVALKVLRSEVATAVGVDRFLREIQIEVALQHPHVLPIHDWGQAAGLPYYVMPYVEGESLRQRIERDRQLPVHDSIQIARDVADALAYAHSRGIVHRDIKPENILLSGSHAIVADFGIARALSAAGGERLTETGVTVGTPAYMSPEQGGAADRIDGRSDLYSLGCVLYEMLAGQPPFTGRTVQAIVARHMHDRPPSLPVVRPQLPEKLVAVVETCLAKVPADRFADAEDLSAALAHAAEGPPTSVVSRGSRRLGTIAVGAALAGAAGTGLWLTGSGDSPSLDPNRVVVFPLRDAMGRGAGEDVATYIGHALDGTEPLRWVDGSDWLSPAERANASGLAWSVAQRRSRDHGARYVIHGAILREPDSVTVVLRLYDVETDSLLGRSGRSGGPGASEARLGALAVGDLLLAIVEPGRSVDVAPLSDRSPAAIAHFLQGERSYRMGRFEEALEHYGEAIDQDSLFALAAVRGGEAANWLERVEDAERLIEVARRQESFLSPRYRHFVRGSGHYLAGAADSAVYHLRRSVELAPEWTEGWVALAEVYYHLLPSVPSPDSLAESAFRQALALDSSVTPAIYHMAEIDLRRGDIASSERRFDRLRTSSPDSLVALPVELMLHCARGGPRGLDWVRLAGGRHASVLEAAKTLTTIPALAPCAESAFQSLLAIDTLAPAQSFAALFGLYCLLVRDRRHDAVRALITSPAGMRFRSEPLYLLAGAAGAPFEREAMQVAENAGSDFASMGSLQLWLLGIWESRRGRAARADTIAGVLAARADSSAQPQDRFLADALTGHAFLAAGREEEASARLAAVIPIARRNELAWTLPDAAGLERLTLAQLRLRQGDYAAAISQASLLDSPQPVAYLLYVRAGLELRERAAAALGQPVLAAQYRSRLRRLGGQDSISGIPTSTLSLEE